MELFQLSGRNAEDFERIERRLTAGSTRKSVERFILHFRVEPQHQESLDAIKLCLQYVLEFKMLYFFCSQTESENENREIDLKSFYNFFSTHTIMRKGSRNEVFLQETIANLINLPIDCIAMQASIGPLYALSNVFSLAGLFNKEDILQFADYLGGATLTKVNDEYIFCEEMNFLPSMC